MFLWRNKQNYPLIITKYQLVSVSLYWALWGWHVYRKNPKHSDTRKICCNHSKIWTTRLYVRVMLPIDADRIANCVDPDQTAPDLGLHCLPRPVCPKPVIQSDKIFNLQQTTIMDSFSFIPFLRKLPLNWNFVFFNQFFFKVSKFGAKIWTAQNLM